MSEAAVVVTQEPKLKTPNKNFVLYIGVASTRIIRENEWPGTVKGAPDHDLVWSAGNKWYISKEGLSADVLSVLADDGNFVISEK